MALRFVSRLSLPVFRGPSTSKLLQNTIAQRQIAGQPASTAAPSAAKILPPQVEEEAFVDFDTEKLRKHTCINYVKDHKDAPVKADSEYPEWLWTLRTTEPPTLDEMDPERDGWEYWKTWLNEKQKQKEKEEKLMFRYAAVQRNVNSLKHYEKAKHYDE